MCVKDSPHWREWRVEIVATDLSQERAGEIQEPAIYSQFEVQRGCRFRCWSSIQADRRAEAAQSPISAAWCSTASSICCRNSPISAPST
jgi:hypothetical protein